MDKRTASGSPDGVRKAIRGVFAAVAVAAALLCAACGGGSDTSEGKTVVANDLGRRVFAEHCASCHGIAGRTPTGTTGEYGPNFDEVKFTSAGYVDYRLSYGGFGMQSFDGTLSGEQRAAVIAYLMSNAGRRVKTADLATAAANQGREIFEEHCATCHAIGGRAATGRPRWPGTDFGEVTPSYDLAMEKAIDGYYWWMPSLRDRLDEARVKAVARWVEQNAGGHPFKPPEP